MKPQESSDTVIENHFHEICQTLGIHDWPEVEVVPKIQSSTRDAIGVYVERKHKVSLLRGQVSDSLIVHELAHVICCKAMGYRGFHGAPFLAILHLIHDRHFDEKPVSLIENVIAGSWSPRLSTSGARNAAAIEAKRLVAEALSYLEKQIDQPVKIWHIACHLAENNPEMRLNRWTSLRWWRDSLMTQKGNLFGHLATLFLITLVGSAIATAQLPARFSAIPGAIFASCVLVLILAGIGRGIGDTWRGLKAKWRWLMAAFNRQG